MQVFKQQTLSINILQILCFTMVISGCILKTEPEGKNTPPSTILLKQNCDEATIMPESIGSDKPGVFIEVYTEEKLVAYSFIEKGDKTTMDLSTFEWDKKDSNGVALPDGTYDLKYSLQNMSSTPTRNNYNCVSITLTQGSYGEPIYYDDNNSPLTDNRVTSLTEDSKGNLWFATSDGILKYDGEFSILDEFNDELTDKSIYRVMMDSDDNLWILSSSIGIDTGGVVTVYDGSSFTHYDRSNSILPNRPAYTLYEDFNNVVWIGTEAGLLNTSVEGWELYDRSNSELTDARIRDLTLDEDEILWIATYGLWGTGGIAAIEDGTLSLRYTEENSSLPSNAVSSFALNEKGELWFGMYESAAVEQSGGLCKLFEGEFTCYDELNSIVGKPGVRSLQFDRTGTLWFSVDNEGLFTYADGEWNTILSGDIWINELLIDSQGNIWGSSTDLGILQVPYTRTRVAIDGTVIKN
ncbi:MAG: hypothetical protein OCD76_10485 [Reichenbachiella sp.]